MIDSRAWNRAKIRVKSGVRIQKSQVDKVDEIDDNGREATQAEAVLHKFKPGTRIIEVQIDATEDELAQQYEALYNWRSTRVRQEVTLYYSQRKSIRKIAVICKVSKSQFHNDIAGYRNEVLKDIKRDVAANKSALGLLVDLITQIDDRSRLLWDKYSDLQRSLDLLSIPLDRAHNRIQENPNARIKNISALKEVAREKRVIIDAQKNILAQLRAETGQCLDVYNAFGLSTIEAIGLIDTSEGEGRLQKKITMLETFLTGFMRIVSEEVTDRTQYDRVFRKFTELTGPEKPSDNNPPNKDESNNEFEFRA